MRKYKEIGLKPVSHSLILAVEIMRLSIFTLSDIIRYICSMQEMIFDYDIEGENILNISGRQINIAKDNATINTIQNNGIDGNELETIIQAIKENLFGLKQDDIEGILDVLEQVKEELDKSEPKKSRLQNYIKIIAPMITIANGIPVLAANLQKLHVFIIQYISNL